MATFRYTNPGTAELLNTSGTTLAVDYTKSITETAFYGSTSRADNFRTPAGVKEIWFKFDLYLSSSMTRGNRFSFGHYSSALGGYVGSWNGSGSFGYWDAPNKFLVDTQPTNAIDTRIQGTLGAINHVLLHMKSDATNGLLELTVNGTTYTRTGNINNGADFDCLYLYSDNANVLFSNIIVSDTEIQSGEGWHNISFDVERRISNRVEFTVPVERVLIEPIIIPFLMGNHFNHLIQNIYLSPNVPEKIILPKKSKVYLHADAINGGAVKIYSDTDATGTVTGDVYAALDECESVFIQETLSPQKILYEFMYWLANHGGADLDGAINHCTGGLFASKDEAINSFFYDHDNKAAGDTFLRDYCGVILDNEDTGAVIGSDAGGGYPKTAKTIVPEPVPVEDWIVPERGSSKIIEGLTVNFPTSGYKGTFTDAENHILAGLNSVWIEQALLLVNKSCGLSFVNWANSGLFSVGTISVKFVNETNNTLAYVAVTYTDNRAEKLELRINMYAYGSIKTDSEDGATRANDLYYLDRTLAHEMTHAIMAACIVDYSTLPLFIKEGIAEFIHGIDDTDTARIRYVHHDNQRSKLESIFSTGGGANDLYVYAAGYLFFRYLIKQTLERGNVSPSSAQVYNLFISDGEVDYYGRALTDNTRAIVSADTLRELVKTSSLAADVEILDVIPVEFTADINRAIKGKVKLFAIDNSKYFSGGTRRNLLRDSTSPEAVIIPSETIPAAPDNTIGLQSIEISLSEQQLTDNVSFVGVVPFDIMYPVKGQYLDYVFDMRVERVQQKGILYSCECCSDVDQLLYTQLAYTVPQSTDWHSSGESTDTVTNDDKSVSAKFHASSIARTIGKTPVIQFDDFASTVLTENLGGATYADMIRDVFGWSSRVPTQMINVFIRDDKMYFVQRGHEARLIDLSGTKHTIPTITHELVRMTWGSTPWSKTETREVEVYRPSTTSTSSSGTSGTGGSGGTGSIGGGSGSGSGTGGGTGTGDNPYDPIDPANPDDDDEDEEENGGGSGGVLTTYDSFDGYPESGYIEYYYDEQGRLVYSYSRVHNKETDKTTKTAISQGYDADGALIYSETSVRTSGGKEKSSRSRTIVEKGYAYLGGEKFLSHESSVTYENGKLVSSKTIFHGATQFGQGTITVTDDGEFSGNVTGQNTGDDRVTPYRRVSAKKLTEKTLETSLKAAKKNSSGGGTPGSGTGTGGITAGGLSTHEEIYAAYQANHEANYYTEQQSRTLNGLSLYDSSFPIHNVGKLVELTAAIKWLNRRTKETVTFTLYEYPHLIDFNDRIIFNGSEYFLVSNVATTNARIFNEQRVSMVRWY